MPAHHTTAIRRQTPETSHCTYMHGLIHSRLRSAPPAAPQSGCRHATRKGPRQRASVCSRRIEHIAVCMCGDMSRAWAVAAGGVTAIPGIQVLDVRVDRPAARDAAAARTGFGSIHGAGPGTARPDKQSSTHLPRAVASVRWGALPTETSQPARTIIPELRKNTSSSHRPACARPQQRPPSPMTLPHTRPASPLLGVMRSKPTSAPIRCSRRQGSLPPTPLHQVASPWPISSAS